MDFDNVALQQRSVIQKTNWGTDNPMAHKLEDAGSKYLRNVGTLGMGSYRTKRANLHGLRLVELLKELAGTPAEACIAGYLERAQSRLVLAAIALNEDSDQAGRVALGSLLRERTAFESMLELDKMEAFGALERVRQCARCDSWIWCRVPRQRYCSERCRVRHYHSSSEGKKYKREWARQDYKRNRTRDREALQSAMISLRGRKRGET